MTSTDVRRSPDPARVATAMRAVYTAFIGAGFAFASWASRIPQVRDRLDLDPAALGLVLLAIAAGSVIALPLAGTLIGRIGSRATVIVMALVLAAAMVVIAVGSVTSVAALTAGLFVMGLSNGAWDVGMNVQGAVVERHLGRVVMSRFHAGFSLGTVIGALLGTAMVALDVPVPVHLAGVAVLVAVVVPLSTRGFVPDVDTDPDGVPAERFSALAAWREPRTLVIGVVVLAFSFAEGTANDWLAVALIDDHGTSETTGTLGFALFLTAMTLARWFGGSLLDRYGRVPVIRLLAGLAVVGLLLFVFGSPPVAFLGALLWGAGASLGFPTGMSAAADDPAKAAARVSVVASIGYCAFLAGPPLIGLLGQQVTVLRALTVVAVLLGVAVLVAGSLRPPAGVVPDPDRTPEQRV
ncbi:MFS transporter [Modestobacter sp. VKM Ac-2983]|uniref:MFS transporter n=1 Tax=Modestobacter sp. VKM Ac-2983 TaxID=3004137 RepID=UPI0022AB932E|nr:MFS transporter [Modestobacter sp. VKM Ac-2983]MCZ2807403.1 MFS transporter [Modestobacter sp. VKM Ac-2983]